MEPVVCRNNEEELYHGTSIEGVDAVDVVDVVE